MKRIAGIPHYRFFLLLALLSFTGFASGAGAKANAPSLHGIIPDALSPKQEYYAIRVYNLNTKEQEEKLDKFLQTALLPALHRMGIPQVGVFTPVGNDTAANRRASMC